MSNSVQHSFIILSPLVLMLCCGGYPPAAQVLWYVFMPAYFKGLEFRGLQFRVMIP